MKNKKPVILIFRIGQLGDTLIAMPAINAIRLKYPMHSLVLLTDQHLGKEIYVSSWDILGPTGWFEKVIYYDPKVTGWRKLKMLGKLFGDLRDLNIEHLFNLAPSRSNLASVRDKLFFKFVVSPKSYFTGSSYSAPKPIDGVLPSVVPEWRNLLNVVRNEHDQMPMHFTLPIPEKEREIADILARSENIIFSHKIIAIGPGSKMPAKKWSQENFSKLGSFLLTAFPNLHLVVFGGKEDAALGDELCDQWGNRSTNLAGKVGIYGSAALLEKCAAYVGNDTGTMHLAAMVGVPCVGLFSARDYPGKWNPYGNQHIVLRHVVACEGCMLETCKYENQCMKMIKVEDAFNAVKTILAK